MATTSFFSASSSSLLRLHTSPSIPFHSPSSIKKEVNGRGILLLRLSCVSNSNQSEPETTPSAPPLFEPSSSSSSVPDVDTDISAYRLCAALGGIGLVETAYLTYLKLTGTDAFCPTSGASCTSILTSDYSAVFGVPLPILGMFAYGIVAFLGIQLGAEKRGSDNPDREMILVEITTSMAVASAYFLYILSTKFSGESCLYCLASATLSFSLFFITLKHFWLDKIEKVLGSQLVIASLVVVALTASYNSAQPVSSSSSGEMDIPYVETVITNESSPLALSLARHLSSIGAKLYGAFWCDHCLEQKEMFGREGAKVLNYVECFPDGVIGGSSRMADACYEIKIKGFPTWVINGEVLSGEKQLSELAILSGMKVDDSS